MTFLHTLSVLLALYCSALSLPTVEKASEKSEALKSTIFEKLNGPPASWIKDEAAHIDKNVSKIKLRIHLVQQEMEKFHDLAIKIATPGHASYGTHLSQQAINEIVGPRDESRDLVMRWIEEADLGSYASMVPGSDSVIVEASISQIESLINAEYSSYTQLESGDSVLRTLQYSLPDTLQGHVDMVQPTTFFGLRAMRSTISSIHPVDTKYMHAEGIARVTGCSGSIITPKCLSNLYNFASSTSSQNMGSIGIAGFLEQHPSKSDLSTFLKSYAIQGNTAQSYTCTLINGGTCPSSGTPGVEANLDVQYARAITKSIPNIFYSVGGRPPLVGGGTNNNEPYLEFLNYLLALPNSSLPNTLSISYGDDEDTVPLDYATNVCNLFAQLGARGVSILVASGDAGVGDTCTSGSTTTFTTSFPASCPWVTVVGGTTGNTPESGWTGSGGGFSSVFARPSYQNASVSAWLTTDTTHASVSPYFNSSGRAYPDVAAQATNFMIVASGVTEGVDGTSCATPTFASLVQLLNSDRLAAGKAPLGFLNPWLYTAALAGAGLTDITAGGNTGCGGVISGAGFEAVAGWDPATGLGTPNYAALLKVSQAT